MGSFCLTIGFSKALFLIRLLLYAQVLSLSEEGCGEMSL